jgi:hypothetical protein
VTLPAAPALQAAESWFLSVTADFNRRCPIRLRAGRQETTSDALVGLNQGAAMWDSGVRYGPMDLRTNGFLNAQTSPSR